MHSKDVCSDGPQASILLVLVIVMQAFGHRKERERTTCTVMEFLSTGSKERRSQMSAMRSAASFSTLFRKSDTTARPGWSLAASFALPKATGNVLNAPGTSAAAPDKSSESPVTHERLNTICAGPAGRE